MVDRFKISSYIDACTALFLYGDCNERRKYLLATLQVLSTATIDTVKTTA